jgi:hypothetical protein
VSAVDVERVGRTMRVLLERAGRPIVYDDPATRSRLEISSTSASSPRGFLPAFLVAGEAVWRDATGKGFALEITRDDRALLGYRASGIGAGTYATVMLSAMEALHQVSAPGAIVVSDFNNLWSAAIGRLKATPARSPAARAGMDR